MMLWVNGAAPRSLCLQAKKEGVGGGRREVKALPEGCLLGKMLLLPGYVCSGTRIWDTVMSLGSASSWARAEGSWQKCCGGTEGLRCPPAEEQAPGQPCSGAPAAMSPPQSHVWPAPGPHHLPCPKRTSRVWWKRFLQTYRAQKERIIVWVIIST